jgi:hypothetical protein
LKPFPAPVLTVEYTGLAETYRAILDADGITLEARAPVGGFRPWQRIFWDEVMGVYCWEAPDWSTILVGVLVAFIGLLLGSLSMALQGNLTASLIWWTLGVLSAAGGWWIGARFRRRQWFRLETATTAVQFHTGRSEVWALLRERLEITTEAFENPPSPAL